MPVTWNTMTPLYDLFTCMFGVLHWKWVNHTIVCHDDVTKWKHFPRYWVFVRVTGFLCGEFPAQAPVMFSLMCAWTNVCTNNPDSGDLRRHHAHCDVTVMTAAIIRLNAQVPVNSSRWLCVMMTSWNGNIFHVTGPSWGETTSHQGIPLTKAGDAELWCFLWCAPKQASEQTLDVPAHCDVIVMLKSGATEKNKAQTSVTSHQVIISPLNVE